jgi:hypothetical protein
MAVYAFYGFKKPVAKPQTTIIGRNNARFRFKQFTVKNKILHGSNILLTQAW